MNSAMTMTQWEVSNSIRESDKPAKLSQEKVYNLDRQRRKFYATNSDVTKLKKSINSQEFLDKFRMTIISNGYTLAKLNSGRKLKVKSIVSEGTFKFYSEVIKSGKSIEIPVATNTTSVVNEPAQQVENNIVEFPRRMTYQSQEVMHNESVAKEPVNNMYSFVDGRQTISPTTEVVSNNSVINSGENNAINTLSRLSRMDYNTSNVLKEAPVRDNTVSIDDYLQHGKTKSSDRDLASLMENNERLNSEISESQKVLEQLEAQLAKLKEISEAKRQARISELKEENLSKTATLNGLTEQIRALQEAIKLEQQSSNEGTIRRVA